MHEIMSIESAYALLASLQTRCDNNPRICRLRCALAGALRSGYHQRGLPIERVHLIFSFPGPTDAHIFTKQEWGGGKRIRCGEGLSWGPGGTTSVTSAALH